MTSGVYTSGFRPPAGFRSPQHCRHRRMCLAWPEGRSLKTPWFALRCRRTRRHVDRAPPLDVTPAAFSTKSKASPCLPLRPSARPSPQTRTIGGLAPPPVPDMVPAPIENAFPAVAGCNRGFQDCEVFLCLVAENARNLAVSVLSQQFFAVGRVPGELEDFAVRLARVGEQLPLQERDGEEPLF